MCVTSLIETKFNILILKICLKIIIEISGKNTFILTGNLPPPSNYTSEWINFIFYLMRLNRHLHVGPTIMHSHRIFRNTYVRNVKLCQMSFGEFFQKFYHISCCTILLSNFEPKAIYKISYHWHSLITDIFVTGQSQLTCFNFSARSNDPSQF